VQPSTNIRKELALDQPKWKQFVLYLNDISPVSVYSKEDITSRQLKGIFIGGDTKLVIKFPYLRRSYQSRKEVSSILMEALPGTLVLAFSAMFIATVLGILLAYWLL
jgi:peptide/nickel transport system permease protein